jgi:hypothetical protein
MDGFSIVLIALGLIIILTAIFTFFTYLFLSIFRRPSARKAVNALKGQDQKRKK